MSLMLPSCTTRRKSATAVSGAHHRVGKSVPETSEITGRLLCPQLSIGLEFGETRQEYLGDQTR